MKILLTNDDGFRSPGLRALYDALSEIGEVKVVAPESERSATSLSITLHNPLRAYSFSINGMDGYYVDGTPADCVKLGCGALLVEKPDFLFSGINMGSNVGLNSNYSGTVAAAVEGAMLGIQSVAISLASFQSRDFQGAVKVALAVLERLQRSTLEPYQFLNVNVPAIPLEELRGIKIAKVGHCLYREEFDRRIDARNREYFWMGGRWTEFDSVEGGDNLILDAGYAAVTPLLVDWTAERTVQRLKENGWEVEWDGKLP